MSKTAKKVRLTEENSTAYDDYSQELESKTELANRVFDALREFDSIGEFEQVVQENSTGDSKGIVLNESVKVSQLEPGHGVPLTLDEAMDLQIATEAKERVAILEAVILGEEDTYISESRIDYLIDQLFFNPAEPTREKYKTILLNKTGINALPGSDPRIMEPVGDFHVAAVESDPDKYDVNSIPSENKRSFVNEMHVSDALYPVWEDIATGYVTDEHVWESSMYDLIESVLESVASLSEASYFSPDRGKRYGIHGRMAALGVFCDRLDTVISHHYDTDVDLAKAYNTMRASGFEYWNTNIEKIHTAIFGDVSESEIESAKDVLGVDTTNDSDVIEAYRSLVLEVHPDMGGSEEEFMKVEQAKETLVKA